MRVTSRNRLVHGTEHERDMTMQDWPLRVAENYEGDSPTRKILLISHVLVGGHQNLESRRLCGIQQVTV